MTRAEILHKAEECVTGRESSHGETEDNFETIAALWSDYKGVDFSGVDVAMMMALLKIARVKSGHALTDSFVDVAGYAACGGEIASKEREETLKPREIGGYGNTASVMVDYG